MRAAFRIAAALAATLFIAPAFAQVATGGIHSSGNPQKDSVAIFANPAVVTGVPSSGTAGEPLIDGGTGTAPAFGTLNLSFTTGTLGCAELPALTGDVVNTNCGVTVSKVTGVSGTANTVSFGNNTSGVGTIAEPAGVALGTLTYTLPTVSGIFPVITGTITTGDCAKFASANSITDAGAACGGSGSPGGTSLSVQYNNAGSFAGLASPTAGAGVYALHYDPTSTTAVAPTLDQVGVHPRSISGATTTDTVLYSDVLGIVQHDKAATGTVNETLPTPASLGNTGFAYTYCNNSPQTDTITPTTYTIAVNGGTAGASISVPTGVCAQISVDPFNSTQWDAFTFGSPNASVDALASGSTVTPSCAYKVNTVTSTAYTISAPTASAATTATTGGTSLAASTTYYVVVTATTASGETVLGTVESVTTGTGTTNTVTANWTDVTGATGYNVYISTSTITAGEASVAYQTALSTATSSTFTAVPGTTQTTPSANTSGQFTVNAPTGCTPYDGQKLILFVQSASGGTLTYSASSYLTGATTGAWPSASNAASKDDHFVLIYDGYLGTPGWTLDGYNLGIP